MTLARIADGKIVEYRELSMDGIPAHKRQQWRSVVDIKPEFDPSKESLTGPAITIEDERVMRVWAATPLLVTREEYGAAVEEHVDAVARRYGYSNAISMISYDTSSVPQFAAEAALMRTWRDSVWITVAEVEASVASGRRPPPPIKELLTSLPPFGPAQN